MRGFVLLLFVMTSTYIATPVMANNQFENDQLKLRINAHTPHQMAAFYEARGFPQAMIKSFSTVCFFTIGIKNKTQTILWHDLAQWKFTSVGKAVQRLDRQYWKSKWQEMNIPMASQSTFRWTLMPEQLDFRPQESEGGNITLPRGPLFYDFTATFHTGADKSGEILQVHLPNIRCAEDKTGETH